MLIRDIIRSASLGASIRQIATSVKHSRTTVSKVLKRAKELNLVWPLDPSLTDASLETIIFPKEEKPPAKSMPNFEHIRAELRKKGVTKKLLWEEYCVECQQGNVEPFGYSHFCSLIQEEEKKHRPTMHLNHRPGEQVEVDWAGDNAEILDRNQPEDSKERKISVPIFVGVLTYSQYVYAEAMKDQTLESWIKAHINMFKFFNGVPTFLVPDNCKTAVIINKGRNDIQLNVVYREMAEYYNTIIKPARVRRPRDKPSVESSVSNVSTNIIARLRNDEFFSIEELNVAIREHLKTINEKKFQKKDGSRLSLFKEEEKMLSPLPNRKFEISEWKSATVQINYHIQLDGIYYSVPYDLIGKKVDVRFTASIVEIFYENRRVAIHARSKLKKGTYVTEKSHMPPNHQAMHESWDSDRLRSWAQNVGQSVYTVIDKMFKSREIEQQALKGCLAIMNLSKKYSNSQLEIACSEILERRLTPSFKAVNGLLEKMVEESSVHDDQSSTESDQCSNPDSITRGSNYYGGTNER